VQSRLNVTLRTIWCQACAFSLGTSARAERELAFANAMGKLHARERNGGCAKGLHGQHRRTTSLDRAMVLLDDVVEIPIEPTTN
jgi:hypothetical protein